LAILAFFTVSCGGIAVGAIFGLITALITRTTQECRGGLRRKTLMCVTEVKWRSGLKLTCRYQELVSLSVGAVTARFSSASVSCQFCVCLPTNVEELLMDHSVKTQ
jgi:hypothetical protein